MSGIFISYRREESAGETDHLYAQLITHFGKDQIFIDTDCIQKVVVKSSVENS